MKIFNTLAIITSFVLSTPLMIAGAYAAIKCMVKTTGAHGIGAIGAAAGAFFSFLMVVAGTVFFFLSFYAIAHPLRAGFVWVAIVIGITVFIFRGAQPDMVIYLGLLIYLLCGCCLIATGIFFH